MSLRLQISKTPKYLNINLLRLGESWCPGAFVADELQHLPTLLNKLEPKEKAEYIIKLLPYIVPRIAPVEAPKQERKKSIYEMFKAQTSSDSTLKQR